MQSLLKSRKFWLAVFAIVQTLVSHYLSIPADVWQAIDGVVMVVIAGIALEDAGANVSINPPTPECASPAEQAQK